MFAMGSRAKKKATRSFEFRLKKAREILLDSWRGYQFGKSMPTGSLPTNESSRNSLEKYFDDHETGPGLWKWRHYFPVYERHLEKFKGGEVRMLEIGVLKGGSLDMWSWYLGDRAQIYGVDISPDCLAHAGSRKHVFVGDQSDRDFWRTFLNEKPSFDIVLDDGGHRSFQQRATFESVMPHLNPGGVYICEDLYNRFNPFTDYLYEFSRSLHVRKPGVSTIEKKPTRFQHVIDSVHLYPYIAVVEKRRNQLDALVAPKRGSNW